MASNVGTLSENMNKESEINCSLKLSESDIPGARLTKPPEQCTMAILKR
jgi:hypothetical protein